jgi:hypothetical protein
MCIIGGLFNNYKDMTVIFDHPTYRAQIKGIPLKGEIRKL